MTVSADEKALALADGIAAQNLALQHRLKVAFSEVGRRIVEKPEIVRALAAAESLPAGLVIADDAKAAEVADLVAAVIDGERLIAAECKAILAVPQAMEKALRAAVAVRLGQLTAAKQAGNGARLGYQQVLERRAREEEAARRAEAEAAAARAAAEQAEFVPPGEVAAPIVPRTVSGGVGKAGFQERTRAVSIANREDVPEEWLLLNVAAAKAAFDAAVAAKLTTKPGAGEQVLYKGVFFTTDRTAVNRRA